MKKIIERQLIYFIIVIEAKGENLRRRSISDKLDGFVSDERLTPDELNASKKAHDPSTDPKPSHGKGIPSVLGREENSGRRKSITETTDAGGPPTPSKKPPPPVKPKRAVNTPTKGFN